MNRTNGSKTALLVEDNPDDEKLILYALRRTGIAHEVVVVHDGLEAIEYLFAFGTFADRDPWPLPDVVLLDLNLPKLGGLEVLERIRAHGRTRALPVVIFSSSVDQEDAIRSGRLGANAFVRKPAALEEFVEAFRQLRGLGLRSLMTDADSVPNSKPA